MTEHPKTDTHQPTNEDWLSKELEAVFHSSYQSVFVTDRNGDVLRVSDSVIHTCGLTPEELIGQNVYDLESKRIFYPSITRKVMTTGKRASVVQHTRSGNTLLVEAVPIKDDDGEIIRVICISKDISELSSLKEQLADLNRLVKNYETELNRLKTKTNTEKDFIVKSKKMIDVYDLIQTVAPSDTSVLILGETGVGKQVIANQIHRLSHRHNKRFMTINCGAIPENLLESELFGYEDGAFSGARKGGKIGIFEMVNGGTVFLDEIGELPLHLQVKILRVLQERKVMRIGGTKEKSVDIRILTATNRDLEKMIREKTFRQDLYYRINVIPIWIPPLRERSEDIYAFIYYFLLQFNEKYHRNETLKSHQLQALLDYSWPGNVRELENTIERFVITGQTILPSGNTKQVQQSDVPISETDETLPLPERLAEIEKQFILAAKQSTSTTRELAQKLGVNQSTVVRKMQKYGIAN